MDYRRIHDSIISSAQSRILLIGYGENHHIIPKSMGGTNDESNIVRLTAREHYLIHWMLFKIHRNKQTAFAWYRMTHMKGSVGRFVSSSFEYAKKTRAKYLSLLFKGRTLSDCHVSLLRKAKQGKSYAELGRKKSPLTGRQLSEDHKMKVAEAGKGRKWSAESKEKMRVSVSGSRNHRHGTKTTDEVKKKISESLTCKPVILRRNITPRNSSGSVGISYNKTRHRWCASISICGHAMMLGRFKDKEVAISARSLAETLFLHTGNEPKNYKIDDLKAIKALYAAKLKELINGRMASQI